GIAKKKMNLADHCKPLVPEDPLLQIQIRGEPLLVGIEDCAPQGGKVEVDALLSEQHTAPELCKQVPEVPGRIAQHGLVKIQNDHAAILPEELGRAEIAVEKDGRRGTSWLFQPEAMKNAPKERSLCRKPSGDITDALLEVAQERGRGAPGADINLRGVQGREG